MAGAVEQRIFGSSATDEQVDAAFGTVCVERLGAGIADIVLRRTSVGVVRGLVLDDGRRVVLKAHQPGTTSAVLAACGDAQRHLHAMGFPCPRPLGAPMPIGKGHATVEELLEGGVRGDPHAPAVRTAMARALARHIRLLEALPVPSALAGAWDIVTGPTTWPEKPHSEVLDFDATAAGAEWIDAVARRARRQAAGPPRWCLGHRDWSAKDLRFGSGGVLAVFDWDSVRLTSEAALVGGAAMTHTSDPDQPELTQTPSPDEVSAFVDAYAAARSPTAAPVERRQVAACATYMAAYIARCELGAPDGADPSDDPQSYTTALRAHGGAYLST